VTLELMPVYSADLSTHVAFEPPTCGLGTPVHTRAWVALGVSHACTPLENIIINIKNILLFIL
jgi:hypothetical protein